jgi:capsule polysaccharide export protein KpsE/RkpR
MERELNFYSVFKILKKNLPFLLIFNLVIVVSVAIYSLMMPQTFTAKVSIMPTTESSSGGGLSSLLNSVSGGVILGGSGGSSKSAIIDETLKSRTLNSALVDRLKLDTLENFKGLPRRDVVEIVTAMHNHELEMNGFINLEINVATGFSPDSNEINSAKKLSAIIANTSVEILDSLFIARSNSSAKISRKYIESQLYQYKLDLDSVAKAMEKFQTENNILAIEKQTEAIVAQAISLYSEIATLETELQLTKIEYSNNSKQVRILERQLEELKKQAQKVQSGGLENNSFSLPLDSVPKYARIYAELFRDRKVLEQVILYLETQRHEEAIQENRDTPVIEVLDYAIVPQKRTSPSRSKMLVAAGSLSFVLSIAFLFLFIFLKESKSNS